MSQSHYIMTTLNLQSAIICVRAKHFTVLHTLGQVTLKTRMSPGQNPNSELLDSHPRKLYEMLKIELNTFRMSQNQIFFSAAAM